MSDWMQALRERVDASKTQDELQVRKQRIIAAHLEIILRNLTFALSREVEKFQLLFPEFDMVLSGLMVSKHSYPQTSVMVEGKENIIHLYQNSTENALGKSVQADIILRLSVDQRDNIVISCDGRTFANIDEIASFIVELVGAKYGPPAS